MKVQANNNSYNQNFCALKPNTAQKLGAKAHKKIANTFANIESIGEGASITFDFFGKAVVVPIVILLASKEEQEKKEYSALKNPVAAAIQTAVEVPLLFLGSKFIENLGNKGLLDKNGKDGKPEFSYNEKLHKENFTKTLEDLTKAHPETAKRGKEILTKLSEKGLNKNLTDEIEEFIETAPKQSKEALSTAFSNYTSAHKRLFHFSNRMCFLAAITLTPLICAFENKLHPIVMDKIYANKHKHEKTKLKNPLSMDMFVKSLNEGGV